MATASDTRRTLAAAAAERRLPKNRPDARLGTLYKNHDEGHLRRQQLRKIIDRDIIESNSLPVALCALETLKRCAESIIQHPGEEKYQRIRVNNDQFNRTIAKIPGAVSYFIEMGFRERGQDWGDSVYIFRKQNMTDLKLGLTLLDEAIQREKPKKEREERARELEKEAKVPEKEGIVKKILDDRKTVQQRQAREATASARRRGSVPPPAPTTHAPVVTPFTGAGRILG